MWKIIFSQIFLIAITTTFGADLSCDYVSTVCNITNVIGPNDPVNLISSPPSTTVTAIKFNSNNQFLYMPTNLFKVFPQLKTITLSTTGLLNMLTNSFDFCPYLETIDGWSLPFTTLPNGFAQNCMNLKTIYFRFGQLTTIEPNALQGLNSLVQLELTMNKITCIPPNLFSPTPFIQRIFLGNNQITALDLNLFSGLFTNTSARHDVDVNTNPLTYLPAFNLANLVNGTLFFTLTRVPIMAIDQNLIIKLESMKMKDWRITMSTNDPTKNITTCVPDFPNSLGILFMSSFLYNSNYQNFTTCYNNWNPAMANVIVPCAVTTTSSTTAVTTTSTSTSTSSTSTSTSSTSTSISSTSSFITAPSDIIQPGTTAKFGSCASDKICRYYLDYMDRYTCVIEGVDGVLTSIFGTHISTLFTDANVTRVYFKNSFLSRIPSVLFTKFPNLDFVSIANCSLGMITDATIPSCGNLAYLDARYNGIFHVSSSAFKNCKNLQTIDFTGNPIDALEMSIFSLDPSLKKVILNGTGK
ncbi:hypothetical protein PVAND_004294 [Polypedilum vanderplanki]|uniref:Uncharacterized protein n=1 Tax=Polypedilum vanderplanki TaxID=319348 RepID=A0A9J6BXQ1_POLVA|nr:hypothetical protein PVAND_004294 [Polypedilum vanderplanki]